MKTVDPATLVATWPERERQWRRELGRIKLGVEPVPVQLERYRLVALVVAAVAGGMGLMFIALFSAFRAPILGAGVALFLMGPVALTSWLGYVRLKGRAERYLAERAIYDASRETAAPL